MRRENVLVCRCGRVALSRRLRAGAAVLLAAVRSGAHAGQARGVVEGPRSGFGGLLLIVAASWAGLG